MRSDCSRAILGDAAQAQDAYGDLCDAKGIDLRGTGTSLRKHTGHCVCLEPRWDELMAPARPCPHTPATGAGPRPSPRPRATAARAAEGLTAVLGVSALP